jgi:hypothetical protein
MSVWSLYNKEEKLRIDDLKAEQVRTILLSIPTAKISLWYACKENDVHWQPLSAIAEFHEDVNVIRGESIPDSKPVPDKPPRRPLFEEAPGGNTETTLLVDSVQTSERRSARRYRRKLNLIVINGGQSFNCETLDISMGGISLSKDLPTWVPNIFKAELDLNQNRVSVICSKVSSSTVKLKEAESWDLIRQWIVNW